MGSSQGGKKCVLRSAPMWAAALCALLLVAPVGRASAICPGDCGADGAVGVDDLLVAVNVALGLSALGGCPSVDLDNSGGVSVDEIVRLVSRAVAGCSVPSVDDLDVGDGFDYGTVRDTLLDVSVLTPNGHPFAGVLVLVYAARGTAPSGDDILYRGVTGPDGRLSAAVSLAAHHVAVRLTVSAFGIPNEALVAIEGNAIVHRFGPPIGAAS